MKQIKVEWCENFIRKTFEKRVFSPKGGIEVNLFWKMAEQSGLWERGTYGTPMSEALSNTTRLETKYDADGNYLYDVFKLA